MKAAALSTVLATLLLVIVSQARPDPAAIIKAATANKTTIAGDHSSMTQFLDLLVKHLQSKGYTVSRLHRDLNSDGSIKHYSFLADRRTQGSSAFSGHISVDIN